jgi:hypothetical protein
MVQAEEWAEALGDFEPDAASLQAEIARLRKKTILSLGQVTALHNFLGSKRKARQSCRIVGPSRTGKSIGCEAYFYRNKPKQETGKKPIVPVVYIHPPQKCGSRELFKEIIEFLKYRVTKGTVADFRGRAVEVLKGCEVEMIIIDEADRLKPETFADVRDFYDKLAISVVLVGTDRLDTVIMRDEQVYNRFRACYRFATLSGDEFVETIKTWEQDVLKLPVASNLASLEMQTLIMDATGGYIGRMDEVLRESAIRALSRGHKKIEHLVLKEVAQEYK